MAKITYNKLVRDRIPEIIESSGKAAITEILDDVTYKRLLDAKLVEELQEYQESDSIEELADLVEVIYAILRYKEVSLGDFNSIRQNKAEERGSFQKRILLVEVSE
ncbi:nucleoside triphosphate pyrophosphohydrolase [Desulfitobacterium sp. THU1]|uniref:nucleoside triphosphate pyrophosphohydrolase n=1 Tax=Desulfitobacterium sp. THU1 TaxID=3138072 RepID=UPI00311DFCF6